MDAVVAARSVDQQPRCYFLELPPEIRVAIYELILISPDLSIEAYKLLDPVGPIDPADQPPRIKGIDSKILRTCSKVLYEAAPILYGKNTFQFSAPRNIAAFEGETGGIFSGPLTFSKTLGPCRKDTKSYGRLQLLRKAHLRMDERDSDSRYISSHYQLSPDAPKKVRDNI